MNHVLIWFFIGAALAFGELVTPGFVIIFFAIGAWASAILAAFWPGLEQELVVFLAVSLLSLLFLRKRLVTTFQGRSASATQNEPVFPHAGRQAEVTRTINADEEGEISLGGSYWRAIAPVTIEAGSQVRVLHPVPDDELLLMVEPLH